MRYIGFLVTFLFCSTAFADLYVGEKKDGRIAQVNYVQGSSDSLTEVEAELEFIPGSLVKVSESELPKEEIKYWKLSGGRIVVDRAKKDLDDETKAIAKQAKKDAKQAVLDKLNITKAELKALLEAE